MLLVIPAMRTNLFKNGLNSLSRTLSSNNYTYISNWPLYLFVIGHGMFITGLHIDHKPLTSGGGVISMFGIISMFVVLKQNLIRWIS